MTYKVGVYGTLRKGGGLHHVIENSQMIETKTISGFVMHHLGSFPAIVEGDGEIVVEIYEVDEMTLRMLDIVEGVGAGLYKRVLVDDIFVYVFGNPHSIKYYEIIKEWKV